MTPKTKPVIKLFSFSCLLFFCTQAVAMPTAGSGVLPWDAPLGLLVTSITGPFAFAAASVGMVIAGSILVFGNDLNRFGQSVMYLILVIGLIVLGVNGLAALFTTGAVVGSSTTLFGMAVRALVAMAAWLSIIQCLLVKLIQALSAGHVGHAIKRFVYNRSVGTARRSSTDNTQRLDKRTNDQPPLIMWPASPKSLGNVRAD